MYFSLPERQAQISSISISSVSDPEIVLDLIVKFSVMWKDKLNLVYMKYVPYINTWSNTYIFS